MPYKIFADGAAAGQGVMDETGNIAVDHHVTTSRYRVELANGASYEVPVNGNYVGEPRNAELANQGLHHHQSQPHPDITPPGSRSEFRESYTQLTTPDTKA